MSLTAFWTLTLNVVVSARLSVSINLCSTSEVSTIYFTVTYVPSYKLVLSNATVFPILDAVISAIVTNWNDVPSTVVVNAVPATIVFVGESVSKDMFTVATGARQDVGSYPKVFAWDTTLVRKAALSRNISFASIFALKPR